MSHLQVAGNRMFTMSHAQLSKFGQNHIARGLVVGASKQQLYFHLALVSMCQIYSVYQKNLYHFKSNKKPAKAFTPPTDKKKIGTIWIFGYYAVYGSRRGRCRNLLVLNWRGGSSFANMVF